MQHLKAIRASAPLSTSGAAPSMSPKHGTHSSRAAAEHAFLDEPRPLLAPSGARQAGAIECESRRKAGCAVTDQQQIARENERNRPHVASCTFVAMDPIFGRMPSKSFAADRFSIPIAECRGCIPLFRVSMLLLPLPRRPNSVFQRLRAEPSRSGMKRSRRGCRRPANGEHRASRHEQSRHDDLK